MEKLSSFKSFLAESARLKSKFDPQIAVVYVYKNDIEYDMLKAQFKKLGYAIAILEKRVIYIDGETVKKLRLSKDELDFIEAHEYSHFKLGKKAKEVECDWLAIANLWKKGYKSAAKIGIDNFVDRHGYEFDTTDLPGYDKWIHEARDVAYKIIEECKNKKIEVLPVLKNPEKYFTTLKTLDRITVNQAISHAWDIYIEDIT